MRRIGDTTRRRRVLSESRRRWYAQHRSARFARSDFKPHHHGVK